MSPVRTAGIVKIRMWFFAVLLMLSFSISLLAKVSFAASTVVSFAGLNERSGILFVARDQGLFRRHGIEVQIVHVRGGPVGIAALASGEIQFHVGSATGASIGAIANGLNMVFIAGLINRLDGNIIVNPRIQRPADLKGKTLGVASIGGGNWMFTTLALEHWGLSPERDNIKFRILGEQSAQVQAIMNGTIDGAYLGYTYGPELERRGYRILADLAKLGIPFQGLGIMTTRNFIDQSPAVAEKVLNSMVDAIAFIQNPANKPAVMGSLAAWLRLERVEAAEAGYKVMNATYDRRIYPNVEGLRNVLRLLASNSQSIRRLKVEDIIDERIVRKLQKEGRLD